MLGPHTVTNDSGAVDVEPGHDGRLSRLLEYDEQSGGQCHLCVLDASLTSACAWVPPEVAQKGRCIGQKRHRIAVERARHFVAPTQRLQYPQIVRRLVKHKAV